MGKLKEFYHECKRVLKVMKKPSKSELKTIIKVSALTILAVGFIGFVITLIVLYLKPF